MSITPNMGLTVWPNLTDVFSHTSLKGDFDLIDLHDHSSGKGVQIPQAGLANNSVGAAQLQASAVTDTKITSGTITDARLASPNNSVYRTIGSSIRGSHQRVRGRNVPLKFSRGSI
jgi:hypothetical protein